MLSHPDVLALGEVLQRQIRARGTSAKAVSVALGWHPSFLTRALRGYRPLRVELVFEVLAKLEAVPFEFFLLVFPFGGNPLESLSGGKTSALDDGDVPPLKRTLREAYLKMGRLPPEEYRLRLGELVAREIRRSGFSGAEVSRRLGLGSTALGQALRGKTQLTFFHVLAALRAAQADPGRVLVSLFLADEPDSIAREARDEALASLDLKAPAGKEAFLRRRERLAAERAAAEAQQAPEAGHGDDEPEAEEPSSTP